MDTKAGALVSKGFKRRISSLLTVMYGIVQTVPAVAVVLPYLEWAAGFFGVTGVGHAAASGTLKKFKAASAASLLASFVAAAQLYPALLPFVPLVQKLAFIFGVFGLYKK